MHNHQLREYARLLASMLMQGADILAKAIPNLRLFVERAENAYADNPSRRTRRTLLRGRRKLAERTAKVNALRNRAKDIRTYVQHYFKARFNDSKDRPHLDLTPYRIPRSGKATGTGVDGKAGILSADGRTSKDKSKAYTTGVTAVGYTTDLTYPVNGSSRSIGKATGKVQGRARQIRGPEPTATGLRLSHLSPFFFYRLGEYHRGFLKVTVTHKGKPSTTRGMNRAEYDRDYGYPSTVGKAVSRLMALRRLTVTVEYAGNGWSITSPRFNTEQVDCLIRTLRDMDLKTRKSWADYQHRIPGLYGFKDLSERVTKNLKKTVEITSIRQWEYWNSQVRKTTNPAPKKTRKPTRKQPAKMPKGSKIWTVKRSAGTDPRTGERLFKRTVKSDPVITHLRSDPVPSPTRIVYVRERPDYYRPAATVVIGKVPNRTRDKRGRYVSPMPVPMPKMDPTAQSDVRALLDGYEADRAIRRARAYGKVDITPNVLRTAERSLTG